MNNIQDAMEDVIKSNESVFLCVIVCVNGEMLPYRHISKGASIGEYLVANPDESNFPVKRKEGKPYNQAPPRSYPSQLLIHISQVTRIELERDEKFVKIHCE